MHLERSIQVGQRGSTPQDSGRMFAAVCDWAVSGMFAGNVASAVDVCNVSVNVPAQVLPRATQRWLGLRHAV